MSIRLLWPFFRIVGPHPDFVRVLARERIGIVEFGQPDTRIGHRVVMELLRLAVARSGDRQLGLRAGRNVQPGDFDALEYAARSCSNLRDAIHCTIRYMQLLNEAARVTLEEDGERAIWRFEITDGVVQERAANDFVVACADRMARLYTGRSDDPLIEVQLMHGDADDGAGYEEAFHAPVRLGMPANAIVFRRQGLDLPMMCANAAFHAAFERYATELVARTPGNVGGRVREIAIRELRGGQLSMQAVGRRLAMSVPTLRRRLDEEGTSYRAILDRVRRELALRYLRDPSLAMTEIAFLLGFAHPTAFHKAFRRWNGTTPADHREQMAAVPRSN